MSSKEFPETEQKLVEQLSVRDVREFIEKNIDYNQLAMNAPLPAGYDEQNPPPWAIYNPILQGNFKSWEQYAMGLIYSKLIGKEEGEKVSVEESDNIVNSVIEKHTREDSEDKINVVWYDEAKRRGDLENFYARAGTINIREALRYYTDLIRSESECFRAYITIDSVHAAEAMDFFIELTRKLHKAGVWCVGKVMSPNSVCRRKESVVIGIPEESIQVAAPIIREYLVEKNIGKGYADCGLRDIDGLLWAFDPGEKDAEEIKKYSPDESNIPSFNQLIAARALPYYFERIAKLHEIKGDTENRDLFLEAVKEMRG